MTELNSVLEKLRAVAQMAVRYRALAEQLQQIAAEFQRTCYEFKHLANEREELLEKARERLFAHGLNVQDLNPSAEKSADEIIPGVSKHLRRWEYKPKQYEDYGE